MEEQILRELLTPAYGGEIMKFYPDPAIPSPTNETFDFVILRAVQEYNKHSRIRVLELLRRYHPNLNLIESYNLTNVKLSYRENSREYGDWINISTGTVLGMALFLHHLAQDVNYSRLRTTAMTFSTSKGIITLEEMRQQYLKIAEEYYELQEKQASIPGTPPF